MQKCQELFQPTSCLNKAATDELIFVLRANDPVAAQTVRHWATMAEGLHEKEKIAEAREWAAQVEAWRNNRVECAKDASTSIKQDSRRANSIY